MSVGGEQRDRKRIAGQLIGLQRGPVNKIAAALDRVALAGQAIEPEAERTRGRHRGVS